MSPREEIILARVKEAFAPLECRLDDDSALHAGHAGAASGAGHYRLRLVSARFEGEIAFPVTDWCMIASVI